MPLTTKPITTKSTWEKFILSQPEANFLQSWNWGIFHEKLGHKVFRNGYYQGKELKGACLIIKEVAKRATYLTIPGGPLIDWQDKSVVKLWLGSIKKLSQKEGAAFVRVRPQLNEGEFSKKILYNGGFRPAPMHLHAEYTLVLDLNLSEGEILKQMRKNTRREVKKTNSSQLTITKSSNPADIQSFYDHQLELANKHKFVPFSYDYLYEQFKVFAADDQVLLISCYEGKKLLASAFVIFYGKEAVYHYGISTPDNYSKPGAYACQWTAIKEAKKRGMWRYNFWGIVGRDDIGHRFYGPSLFKRGFGGQEVQYLHAHDLPINWRYWPNWLLETVRRKRRGL